MKPHDVQARCPKCNKRVTAVMSYEMEDYDKGIRNAHRMTCTECRHVWYDPFD